MGFRYLDQPPATSPEQAQQAQQGGAKPRFRYMDEAETLPQNQSIADTVNQPLNEKERSWGEATADFGKGLAVGTNQLLNIGGTLYGLATGDMDNWAREQGQSGVEYWSERQSPILQAKKQHAQEVIDAGEGFKDKLAMATLASTVDPAMFSNFIAEQLPMLGPIGIAGRGGKVLATQGLKTARVPMATKTAANVINKTGTGAAVGTGAAMQASDAGGDAYDQVIAEGGTPEQAEEAASRAALESGLASVLTNTLPGTRVMEKALAGSGQPVKSRFREGLKGLAGETIGEMIEEGSGKWFANLETTGQIPELSTPEYLWKGVSEQAGMAAPAGVFGFGGGVVSSPEVSVNQQPVDSQEDVKPYSDPVLERAFEANREIMEANGITDPYDPRVQGVLEMLDRRAQRQAELYPEQTVEESELTREDIESGEVNIRQQPFANRQARGAPNVILGQPPTRAGEPRPAINPEDQGTIEGRRRYGVQEGDAELVEEYVGIPRDEFSQYTESTQLRLIRAAREAQQRETGRPTYAAEQIIPEGETGPTSPRSTPQVPGEREPFVRGEYEDTSQRAIPTDREIGEMKPTEGAKRAARRKEVMVSNLDKSRRKKAEILANEGYQDLRAKYESGRLKDKKEIEIFQMVEGELKRLSDNIFSLESRIYEIEGQSELGSRAASGRGDRPYVSEPTSGETEEQTDYFRQRAETMSEEQYAKAEEELLRKWKRRSEYEQQNARERAEQRAKAETAQDKYQNAQFTDEAAPLQDDGTYKTDEFNFVLDKNGAPIKFADHKAAARWVLTVGNRQSPRQTFELHNHPSGDGLTIEVTQTKAQQQRYKGPESRQIPGPEAMREAQNATEEREVQRGEGEEYRGNREGLQTNRENRAQQPEESGRGNRPSSRDRVPETEGEQIRERIERALFERDMEGPPDAGTSVTYDQLQKIAGVSEDNEAQANVFDDVVDEMLNDGRLNFHIGNNTFSLRTTAEENAQIEARNEDYYERNPQQTKEEILAEDEADVDQRGRVKTKREEARKAREKLDPENDSLLVAIAKLGGINFDAAAEANMERRGMRVPDGFGYKGIKWLVNRNGMNWDTVREKLVEEGYYPPDEGYNRLLDMFDNELKGGPQHYSGEYQGNELIQREIERQETLEYESHLDAAEDGAQVSWDDMELTQDEINEFLNEVDLNESESNQAGGSRRAGTTDTETDTGNEAAGQTERRQGARREQTGRQNRESDEFELESYTEEELRAREEAREKAESEEDARQREADARQAADRAREDFTLTGSERQADQNPRQKDVVEEARRKKNPEGGTLYSTPFHKIFPIAIGSSKAWARELASFNKTIRDLIRKRHPDAGIVARGNFLRLVFDSSSAHMRARVKKTRSKTAQWVIDQFHRESGSGKYMGEIFEASLESWVTSKLTRIDKVLEDLTDNQLQQVRRQVTSGRLGDPKTRVGRAAHEIKKINEEAYDYLKENGVDVGQVKRGYLHRQIDPRKVIEVSSEQFIRDAAKAFRRTTKSAKEARELAADLYLRVLHGEERSGLGERSGGNEPFMRHRVFGREVDNPGHPMHKYFNDNLYDTMSTYLSAVGKRAEISKRFGDNFSNWANIEKKIRAEGGGDIVQDLESYVNMATGNQSHHPGTQRVSSVLRTWGALMFLSKATLSSIPEFIVPAMRTGNVADAMQSFRFTVADLFNSTYSAQERRAFAEDLGLVAGHLTDNMMVERWAGGDPVSTLETKLLTNFFRRTGLTQWTAGTVVSSVQLGRIFLRRLAKSPGKLNNEYLMELGIPENKIDQFREYVNGFDNGFPKVSELKGEMGNLYASAIRTFSYESVMRPSKALRPRWMAHPIGAVMGQLQSFNFAFWENVVKRTGRGAARAISAKDYTAMERLRLVTPTLMVPMLWAVAAVVGEMRDEFLGDPERRAKETTLDKALKAFSRGTPIAPLDPLMNYVTSARYKITALKFVAGPVLGTAGEAADDMLNYYFNNSPRTNTAERKLAKDTWNLFVEPFVNVSLGFTPVSLLTAAATQAVSSGRVREKFMEKTAGPYQGRGKGRFSGRFKDRSQDRFDGRF